MQLSNEQDLNRNDPNFFNVFTEDNRVESVDFIEDVYLKMPTFKIKTDMDAAEPLHKLGVHRVFSQNAELGGISNAPISVSRIKHSSLVEVTKEGTEGAAATGVEIALFSAAFGEQIDIVVDRPFIFVVQDRKNKIPVLVGKITDPTKI
jgi:serpin B